MRTATSAVGRRLFQLGALALLLEGCANGSDLPPLPPASTDVYRLGAGDVVRIITFGDQQLTGEFNVSDSGTISVPLLGTVPAAGLSAADLAAKLTQALVEKNLFRDPSVSVEVTKYRPIFVLGEVSKPGEFPYQPGMNVLTAVAVAGGFTYRAVQDYVGVLRQTSSGSVEGRASREATLQPGDVVTVFERRF